MADYSYWEKHSFLRSVDLVIVGAGIVGLSSALFYKKANPQKRVMVLEKGAIPEGASTCNAGFACIGSIGEHLADLAEREAKDLKRRIKKRYDGLGLLIETLGEKEIGYENCGGFELFTDEQAFLEAKEQIDRFNAWLEELTGEEKVYRPWKLNGYNVIHNRLEGALHPGRMMQRLAELVQGLGVEIRWNSTVDSVQDQTLSMEDGTEWRAKRILIAANGFTRHLLPSIPIDPARGYIFITDEISELDWRGTFHHDRGYIYFRNVGDRLLLGGARNVDRDAEQTDQFGINDSIRNHLIRFADETLRLGENWQIEQEWSGIMGFTDSKDPIVKRMADQLVVAAGLSGMGVAIGMQVAREAVKLLQEI